MQRRLMAVQTGPCHVRLPVLLVRAAGTVGCGVVGAGHMARVVTMPSGV